MLDRILLSLLNDLEGEIYKHADYTKCMGWTSDKTNH